MTLGVLILALGPAVFFNQLTGLGDKVIHGTIIVSKKLGHEMKKVVKHI